MSEPISTAADFAEPETKVLELPRPGAGGKKLFVKIRAVPVAKLLKEMEGIPELRAGAGSKEERTFAQARELLMQQEAPSRRIAELCIVEPLFSFGEPEEGKAPWENVHAENATYIVEQGMALAGLTGGADKPAEAAATEFRGVAGK